MTIVSNRAALVALTAVVSVLTGLYFIPEKIRTRHYSLPGASDSQVARKVSVDRAFPVAVGEFGLSGRATLAQVMQKSGSEVLIVNFWATWCPPCLEELPSLESLNRQLRTSPKGYPRVASISVDEESDAVHGLFNNLDFKPTLLVLHDPLGDFSKILGTTKFPETYLIDRSGTVLEKWVGPQDWLGASLLEQVRRHVVPGR